MVFMRQNFIQSVRTIDPVVRWPGERASFSIARHLAFIRRLLFQGGPEEAEYEELDRWFACTRHLLVTGSLIEEEIEGLRAVFGPAMSPATVQGYLGGGFARRPVDVEFLDRIQQGRVAVTRELGRWDKYFHRHPAAQALRHRASGFQPRLSRWIRERVGAAARSCQVLVVGAGRGRVVYDFLCNHPFSAVRFVCLEFDEEAREYGTRLNEPFGDRVEFRPGPEATGAGCFDYIWAPTAFDGYEDAAFSLVLQALLGALDRSGRLEIEVLADTLPGPGYLEFCGWRPHRRSAAWLLATARSGGVKEHQARVIEECERSNLRLQIDGRECSGGGRAHA